MKKIILLYLLLSIARSCAAQIFTRAGARSAALAHASVTLPQAWAVHHNPALLTEVKKVEAEACVENRFMLKETRRQGLAAVLPLKRFSAGLSYFQTGYELLSESYTSLAFALKLNERFSAGIQTGHYLLRQGDRYGNRHTLHTTLGVYFKLSRDLAAGISLHNPHRPLINATTGERQPATIRMGLSRRQSERLLLLTEAEKDTERPLLLKAAVEYQAHPQLWLRLGISGAPLSHSFGIGLKRDRLLLDIAVQYHPVLGFSPGIGFTYNHPHTINPTPTL